MWHSLTMILGVWFVLAVCALRSTHAECTDEDITNDANGRASPDISTQTRSCVLCVLANDIQKSRACIRSCNYQRLTARTSQDLRSGKVVCKQCLKESTSRIANKCENECTTQDMTRVLKVLLPKLTDLDIANERNYILHDSTRSDTSQQSSEKQPAHMLIDMIATDSDVQSSQEQHHLNERQAKVPHGVGINYKIYRVSTPQNLKVSKRDHKNNKRKVDLKTFNFVQRRLKEEARVDKVVKTLFEHMGMCRNKNDQYIKLLNDSQDIKSMESDIDENAESNSVNDIETREADNTDEEGKNVVGTGRVSMDHNENSQTNSVELDSNEHLNESDSKEPKIKSLHNEDNMNRDSSQQNVEKLDQHHFEEKDSQEVEIQRAQENTSAELEESEKPQEKSKNLSSTREEAINTDESQEKSENAPSTREDVPNSVEPQEKSENLALTHEEINNTAEPKNIEQEETLTKTADAVIFNDVSQIQEDEINYRNLDQNEKVQFKQSESGSEDSAPHAIIENVNADSRILNNDYSEDVDEDSDYDSLTDESIIENIGDDIIVANQYRPPLRELSVEEIDRRYNHDDDSVFHQKFSDYGGELNQNNFGHNGFETKQNVDEDFHHPVYRSEDFNSNHNQESYDYLHDSENVALQRGYGNKFISTPTFNYNDETYEGNQPSYPDMEPTYYDTLIVPGEKLSKSVYPGMLPATGYDEIGQFVNNVQVNDQLSSINIPYQSEFENLERSQPQQNIYDNNALEHFDTKNYNIEEDYIPSNVDFVTTGQGVGDISELKQRYNLENLQDDFPKVATGYDVIQNKFSDSLEENSDVVEVGTYENGLQRKNYFNPHGHLERTGGEHDPISFNNRFYDESENINSYATINDRLDLEVTEGKNNNYYDVHPETLSRDIHDRVVTANSRGLNNENQAKSEIVVDEKSQDNEKIQNDEFSGEVRDDASKDLENLGTNRDVVHHFEEISGGDRGESPSTLEMLAYNFNYDKGLENRGDKPRQKHLEEIAKTSEPCSLCLRLLKYKFIDCTDYCE